MIKELSVKVLEDLKLENICVYSLINRSPFFDYLICATASSDRQAYAVFEHLKEEMAKNGIEIKNVEGKNSTWVLVDLGSVIVNVFNRESRSYYDLDTLYFDLLHEKYN